MNPLFRILATALANGAQIAGKAFMEAYQQAVINAKASGGAKQAAEKMGKSLGRSKMTVDEAKQVLNLPHLDDLTKADIEKSFKKIFESNDVSKGGSFYLQSKIYRARESILRERNELDEEEEEGKSGENTEGKESSEVKESSDSTESKDAAEKKDTKELKN